MYVCVFYRLYSALKKLLVKNQYYSSISTKLGKIDPWVKGFQSCSKNFIPCRKLVAMATKRNNKKKFKNLVKTNKA
jgi:NRPS condensation-like uncharacterized protein